MELQFRNGGDYIPSENGGFKTVTGVDEILQRVMFKLTARRGAFPFLPELGSRLYTLSGEKRSNRQSAAEQFIIEALSDEPEIVFDEAVLKESGNELDITVKLDYLGTKHTLTLKL